MTATDVRPPTTVPPPVRPPARTPRWWRDACLGVAGGSVAAVVLLWLQGHPQLGTPAQALTSLGRVTGLVGSDLLLLQVLLMARIPVVERAFGQDALARAHRVVGLTSVDLVLAHVVLVLVGYSAQGSRGLLGETVEVVWTYPGMLLATAGFAALVMVVVTSVRAARAKLRYESWHLLHLYAYLGVGLALPHQLWTGADLLDRPAATAFWWTAWALTAVAVLVFRVGMPVVRSLRHRLVVDRVVAEAPGVVSVHLRGRALDRLPARAGQFFVFRFAGEGVTRGNPYSLSAAPDGCTLRITAKDLGDGSGRLATLRPGTRVWVEGPYGRLTADVRTRPKLAVLTAGIGIAPGLALLQETTDDAVLVHRTSTADDLLFADELEQLSARGVRVVTVPGHRADRPSWLPREAAHLSDREALLRLVPDLAERDVYVCGGAAWAAAAAAAAGHLPPGQVHVERFSW